MIRILPYGKVSPEEIFSRCEAVASVGPAVAEIIAAVRKDGDAALRCYAEKFDKAELKEIEVPAAVLDAAQRLSSNQTESSPALSLATTDPVLAAYADRVYLTSSDGSQVQSLVNTFADVYDTLHDRVVFLTDSRDTRFADYGILRPAVTEDDEE